METVLRCERDKEENRLPNYLRDNAYRLKTSPTSVSKGDYQNFLKYLVKSLFLFFSLNKFRAKFCSGL
jgi:hypothetical protein